MKFFLLTLALSVGMLVTPAQASPVLTTDDFDSGSASGWEVSGPDGVGGVQDAGGHPNGYYQYYFASTPVPVEEVEYIFNRDANHTGNYSNLIVSFDFFVSPVSAPAVALNVYFRSGSTLWYNEFTVPANAWTPVTVNFLSQGTWRTLGSTDFYSDIGNVSRIGIQVHHFNNNLSEYTYGLDNWNTGVMVPEPESIALAFVALLSLCITFRKPMMAVVRIKRDT